MCRHGDDFVPGGCSTTTFQLAVRSDGGATKAAATENLRMGPSHSLRSGRGTETTGNTLTVPRLQVWTSAGIMLSS